jgi:hypothetical protein
MRAGLRQRYRILATSMAEIVLGFTPAQLIGLGFSAAGFLYTVVSDFLKKRKDRQTRARQHLELQDRLVS